MLSNTKPDVTIIVATSDEFEDCWDPFFTLFKRFWPDCSYPIVLTTSKKKYTRREFDIECSQAQRFYSHNPTWSERLLCALEKNVKTNIVLFLQEDFFLTGNVDEETILNCCGLLCQNNYSCITLTNHATRRVSYPTENPLLSKIDDKSPYRVTTLPALWMKQTLKRYIKPAENIWMFEIFGTRRSYKIKDSFYKVNEDAISKGYKEVIPYFETEEADSGIAKGKWQTGIEELFDSAGIKINYETRGYFKKLPSILNKYYLAKVLLKNPKLIIPGLFGWI